MEVWRHSAHFTNFFSVLDCSDTVVSFVYEDMVDDGQAMPMCSVAKTFSLAWDPSRLHHVVGDVDHSKMLLSSTVNFMKFYSNYLSNPSLHNWLFTKTRWFEPLLDSKEVIAHTNIGEVKYFEISTQPSRTCPGQYNYRLLSICYINALRCWRTARSTTVVSHSGT